MALLFVVRRETNGELPEEVIHNTYTIDNERSES